MAKMKQQEISSSPDTLSQTTRRNFLGGAIAAAILAQAGCFKGNVQKALDPEGVVKSEPLIPPIREFESFGIEERNPRKVKELGARMQQELVKSSPLLEGITAEFDSTGWLKKETLDEIIEEFKLVSSYVDLRIVTETDSFGYHNYIVYEGAEGCEEEVVLRITTCSYGSEYKPNSQGYFQISTFENREGIVRQEEQEVNLTPEGIFVETMYSQEVRRPEQIIEDGLLMAFWRESEEVNGRQVRNSSLNIWNDGVLIETISTTSVLDAQGFPKTLNASQQFGRKSFKKQFYTD